MLYLLFFYFKLARVNKKEERLTPVTILSHVGALIAAVLLYRYGFTHYSALTVGSASLLFFVLAALNVTAVQLGIFKDGKPMLGITRLYGMIPVIAAVLLGYATVISL
jgi:hypothetical protein